MKSKFNKYIVVAALIFFSAGCTKKLDINPTQSIDETQALLTSSDVEAALVGAYSDLGDGDVLGGEAAVESELLADFNEFNWTGTFQGLTQIYNKLITVDNTFVRDTWLDGYKVINDVNNVLTAINIVLPNRQKKVEGEAKFIRATVYFELVRLFARAWNDGDPNTNDGVPIILTPTRAPLTDANKKGRDKVAAVYAQIITDLTEAEAALPLNNGFFATKSAAAAMLARVYLQKGDYANAAAAANRVISTYNRHSLTDTYAEAFPFNASNLSEVIPNTSEDVFAIQVTNSQGINDFNTYFSPFGRGDIDIRDEHLNLYDPNDERLLVFYDDGSGSIRTGKFDMIYGNVHVIRLAEVYLIRAEANFRLNPASTVALSDINRIRNRAGLPSYTLAQLTLANILLERKLELAFEGHNLHDVKRLQKSVGSLAWNSPKLVFPIPDRERKVNPNLSQNSGY